MGISRYIGNIFQRFLRAIESAYLNRIRDRRTRIAMEQRLFRARLRWRMPGIVLTAPLETRFKTIREFIRFLRYHRNMWNRLCNYTRFRTTVGVRNYRIRSLNNRLLVAWSKLSIYEQQLIMSIYKGNGDQDLFWHTFKFQQYDCNMIRSCNVEIMELLKKQSRYGHAITRLPGLSMASGAA